MTRRGTRQWLEDIQTAARDAIDFCAGLDEAAFAVLSSADRRTYRALKNALAEIGEAVKLLPPDILAKHSEVDWRGWAGLRDMVAHQYFSIELPRLRPAIVVELPMLLKAVEHALNETAPDQPWDPFTPPPSPHQTAPTSPSRIAYPPAHHTARTQGVSSGPHPDW
jgi:uncharacterized protein with HEPN domain